MTDAVTAGAPGDDTQPSIAGRTKRRFFTGRVASRDVIAALLGVGLSVVLSTVWWDVLLGNYVPMLQAGVPVLLPMALVPILWAVLRQNWLNTVVAALVCAVGLGSATSIGYAPAEHSKRLGTSGHGALTVMSSNVLLGQADTTSVMSAVTRTRPDVIVFLEMTRAKLDQLDGAGLGQAYPYRTTGMVDSTARGSIIVSRFPVKTLDENTTLGPRDLQSPVASVRTRFGPVLVHAVHTYPPIRDGVREWRPQLQRLGRWQRQHAGERLIMAGDFNASRAHPAFRETSAGLTDSVARVKTGLFPTWPHGDIKPPFTQIDHILTRGFTTGDGGVIPVAGTDHAAVWARLSL